MNFDELILRRESCRKYTGELITDEELLACAEAARLAPSACNSQPWRFIAVNDKKSIARLAPTVQDMGMNGFASDAGALVAVVETGATLKEIVASRMAKQSFAPGDVGIATAYFVLKAAEMGLDTCILGWLDAKKACELLGIGENETIHYILAVGHRTEAAIRPKKRKDMSEIYKKVEL